jgi:hypothetical protein
MQQSNSNDVGNGDGNNVAGNKKGNGKGSKAHGDGDEGAGKRWHQHGQWQRQCGWWATKKKMAKAARGVVTTTKRAMGTATTWAMAVAMRVEGNEDGGGEEKGKGGKGNGDSNNGGGHW